MSISTHEKPRFCNTSPPHILHIPAQSIEKADIKTTNYRNFSNNPAEISIRFEFLIYRAFQITYNPHQERAVHYLKPGHPPHG